MSKIESFTIKFEVEKLNGKGFHFMANDGESVACATGSSQDLAGKVSKTYKYIKRGLRGDRSNGGKYDQLCLADEVTLMGWMKK